MGDCTALAIIPKRPRANTSDEEIPSGEVFKYAEPDVVKLKEDDFRLDFPEYNGVYVHTYEGYPCYARMGVVHCDCNTCEIFTLPCRKRVYGVRGTKGFPGHYIQYDKDGIAFFHENALGIIEEATGMDMMILNKTRSKMIDFCKKKKKDLMEAFPGFEKGRIVFNNCGQFCFFRMDLINCTCFKCQGLMMKETFIQSMKLKGGAMANFQGPDMPGAPCSFERQAYDSYLVSTS